MKIRQIYKTLLFLTVTAVFVACEKEGYQTSIPYARVNFSCDMLYAPYSYIQIGGQFLTARRESSGIIKVSFPGQPGHTENKIGAYVGFGGLILGHSTFGNYYAFDLACPVEANAKTLLQLSKDKPGKATCPQCGTVYDLNSGGFPESGAGKERLATYRIQQNGTKLSVQN